jgi:hypothetical protein
MNAKSFISKFGLGMVAAVVLGILAALPAQAGSGLIKITHSDTPYKGGYQTAPSTFARTAGTVSQTTPSEIQIAIMASSPSQPGAKRSVFIHR